MKTMPLAITLPFFPYAQPDNWTDLDVILKRCWKMSTKLANWSMSQLYHVDILTQPKEGEKFAPMPEVNLYQLFTRFYADTSSWEGGKQQAATIFKSVQDKYKQVRFDVIGRGMSALPSFRYPFPFPVHNQSWKPLSGPDNVPLVEVRLPGDGPRTILRLRGGSEMRRQLDRFDQLLQGARCGEMSLYKKGDHCMCKLVGHFPIVNRPSCNDVSMYVHTDPAALWVVEIPGRKTRIWNQDHIRGLIERHRVFLQRISEDMKYEKRVPERMRRHMQVAIEKRCRKQNDRLESFCHEMTAQLVQFAQRQQVGRVFYQDECTEWMPRFPWFRLKEKLAYKLKSLGIDFVYKTEASLSSVDKRFCHVSTRTN